MAFNPFDIVKALDPVEHIKRAVETISGKAKAIKARRPPVLVVKPKKREPIKLKNISARDKLKEAFAKHRPAFAPSAASRIMNGTMLFESLVKPALDYLGGRVQQLTTIVTGINRRVDELGDEVDELEEKLEKQLPEIADKAAKDYAGPLLEEAAKVTVASDALLLSYLVEADPDLPSDKKREIIAQAMSATNHDMLKAVVGNWTTESSRMWNRVLATAPQTLISAIAVVFKDSGWITGSPDARLSLIITAVVAFFVGNDKLTWVVQGVIPAIKFLRSFLGVPLKVSGTMESRVTVDAFSTTVGPDVVNGLSFTTTLKAAPQLLRTDMEVSFSISGAELVTSCGSFALEAPRDSWRPLDLDAGKSIALKLFDRAPIDLLGAATPNQLRDAFFRVYLRPSAQSANGSWEPSVIVSAPGTITLPTPPAAP